MTGENTVPYEALFSDHPDHEWWVERTGKCLAGDDCPAHAIPTGGALPPGHEDRLRDTFLAAAMEDES